MQLKYQDLTSQLKNDIAPCYLLFGAELLLVEDSATKIRTTLGEQGFDERVIFTVETGFDWSQFAGEFDSLSLFSQKKFIELRLPTAKPGIKGAEMLAQLVKNPVQDTKLLILCGKFEASTKNTKWVKSIAHHGVVIEHFPITANQLMPWIAQRARQYQVNIEQEACRLLAFYLEGNLLALDQQLKKFSMQALTHPVTSEMVQQTVEDSARFTIYSLVDSAMAGNLRRALRMLASLRAEGVEPVLLNWALSRETRNLLEMATELKMGKNISAVLKQYRVWSHRSGIVQCALKRLSLSQWQLIHRRIALLDRTIKGRDRNPMKANIWTEYEQIISALCGVNKAC